MKALLIGSTILEELGIPEYIKMLEGFLGDLGVEILRPNEAIERKALLLYAIGARIMASEGLSVIARQALEADAVLYAGPCVRKAFKELRFSTPVAELTVHEYVVPRIPARLSGKALLACSRRFVRPEISTFLRSYGLEPEEGCVFPFMKVSEGRDYIRVREYVARRYRGYILTCPLQKVPFKDEAVPAEEILEVLSGVREERDHDNRGHEGR